MNTPKILGEKVVYQKGKFKSIMRWLQGWHPERGVLTYGLTGKETIETKDIIILHKFEVKN